MKIQSTSKSDTNSPAISTGTKRLSPEARAQLWRYVQSGLGKMANVNLPVTGVPDAQTRSLIKQFQGRVGLKPTGLLTKKTLTKLARIMAMPAPSTTNETGQHEDQWIGPAAAVAGGLLGIPGAIDSTLNLVDRASNWWANRNKTAPKQPQQQPIPIPMYTPTPTLPYTQSSPHAAPQVPRRPRAYAGPRTLRFRMAGQDVLNVQSQLARWATQEKLPHLVVQPTGRFGEQTQAAVMEFQKRHQLFPDGIVGNQTRMALARY
ncbi:MAG: peptidoglycan-binding protein [Myxococcales bacterium]|nr:peptidoglycan-binding protein [Myxococcales bacterium]